MQREGDKKVMTYGFKEENKIIRQCSGNNFDIKLEERMWIDNPKDQRYALISLHCTSGQYNLSLSRQVLEKLVEIILNRHSELSDKELDKTIAIDFKYPSWICKECAKENLGVWPKGHTASFHTDTCGWCLEEKEVTEPRDWGYPKYEFSKKR